MTLHRRPTPPKQLREAVAQALPALPTAWQPLAGGRVNRLWRAGDTVIKLYDPNGESPLFPNDPQAEAHALAWLAPFGIAPTLQATGTDWLAYQYQPGSPWRGTPQMVAAALTRLHQLPPPPQAQFRLAANGSAKILGQARAIGALCQATLPPAPPDPGVPAGLVCMIHGDAVPGNLIAHQDQITFIDWQCPALGDPADDIATFLSPAMQWLYRGQPLNADETSAFLAACPPRVADRYRNLKSLYHWRMAAHCLWKAEQGDPDYAKAMHLELAAL